MKPPPVVGDGSGERPFPGAPSTVWRAPLPLVRLVIKTSVLERVIDVWPSETQRRAHYLHRGTIWLSETRLSLSRTVPTPPT